MIKELRMNNIHNKVNINGICAYLEWTNVCGVWKISLENVNNS